MSLGRQNNIETEGENSAIVNVDETAQTGLVKTFVAENYGKASVILGMGAAAGLANIEHGSLAVLTAGFKQGAYSAASATVLLSFYNYLANMVTEVKHEYIPIVVPTLITILANYGVHNFKGTAEPELSTLPTAIAATVGFPIWHARTRLLELWKDFDDIKIEL